jgi:hypothetical protein
MNAAELGHQMGLMIPLVLTQNILMNLGFSTPPFAIATTFMSSMSLRRRHP